MPKGDHGGSAGGGGFDFQADVFAYVACHVLSEQPLAWFSDTGDVPVAAAMETAEAGDDLRIELHNSNIIQLQAKQGVQRGEDLWGGIFNLVGGLQDDPALRAIFLVDNTASGTVKDDLRIDIERLAGGRQDDLKSISAEFLARLKAAGISDLTVLRRMRLIVLDVHDASQGRAAAIALLRTVLRSPQDTLTAWDLLAKLGLRIIRNRGRCDYASLLGKLKPHVSLSEKSENHAVVLERLRAWVEDSTGTFHVPVLGINLPVTVAWNRLRPMEDISQREPPTKDVLARQIAAYHEWETLAKSRRNDNELRAEDVLVLINRSVIVGGPGSGKSTLLTRVAHWAASEGQTVLLVSLKIVRQLIKSGKTFNEAIVLAGCDGFDFEWSGASSVLSRPTMLLADGLDECDPDRSMISSKLAAWSMGHSNCRVCVTTRPVGHSPDLLPGYAHVELLPLDSGGVDALSRALIKALVPEPDQAEALGVEFAGKLEEASKKHGVLSLASRNPLLLSFMVCLFRAGEDFGQNRVGLFGKIVEMFRRDPAGGRAVHDDLARAIAELALYRLAQRHVGVRL